MNRQQVIERVQASFGFSVDKFPLSGPDGLRTPWFGLFRSDNGNPVGNGSVTNVYTPHQTDDVIALAEAAVEAFDGEIDVRCGFRNGHYLSLMPSRDYRKMVAGTDAIWPRVLVHAGYDAKAFRASMGYYRDACRNLAILRQVSGTSVCIRHTSGLRSKMDDLIASFNQLKTGWAKLSDVIESLSNRRIQMVAFLNTIYPPPDAEASTRSVTLHRNRTEAIFRRLQRESVALGRDIGPDFTTDAWLAFNAIQGYVQHDMSRHGSPDEFNRMLLASEDQAVKRAEEEVMQLLAV